MESSSRQLRTVVEPSRAIAEESNNTSWPLFDLDGSTESPTKVRFRCSYLAQAGHRADPGCSEAAAGLVAIGLASSAVLLPF